ncbi:hypothetical protein [Amycolatopsis magusensis]|uniref:DNA-directed RNA polymerase specialized sigma24 family protein n=1 Tax=Amycolatopsis magusensis TaxID=882444 RepID=A0ABS4PWT4_9PSEU|nr:hypothetical protein [Amycolatopsis magusensis]MBP2183880.1 DNA-directed RNA polymerase specialized sigma24 family protein [Amycolatopsis magusensis]
MAANDDTEPTPAESAHRLLHDQRLRDALATDNFQGHGWDRFANDLAGYGLAVITAWIHTGHIFAECRRRNLTVGSIPALDAHDCEELASDTVATAMIRFRDKALIGGKWNSAGGASLSTYFIGACVFAFHDRFAHWRNQHIRRRTTQELRPPSDAETEAAFRASPAYRAPEPTVITNMMIEAAFDRIDNSRLEFAIRLHTEGYSLAEIAELLTQAGHTTTPGAIRELLARQRHRGSTWREEETRD